MAVRPHPQNREVELLTNQLNPTVLCSHSMRAQLFNCFKQTRLDQAEHPKQGNQALINISIMPEGGYFWEPPAIHALRVSIICARTYIHNVQCWDI